MQLKLLLAMVEAASMLDTGPFDLLDGKAPTYRYGVIVNCLLYFTLFSFDSGTILPEENLSGPGTPVRLPWHCCFHSTMSLYSYLNEKAFIDVAVRMFQ